MTHPNAAELALFAGGDCGRLARWRIARHIGRCEACRAEVEAHRNSGQALREFMSDLPAGVNWDRLAEEMTGNIRVGLAAGACVGDFPPRHRRPLLQWNIAMSMAMLVLLFGAAFLVNLPAPQAEHLVSSLRRVVGLESAAVRLPVLTTMPSSTVLEASPQQIGMWSNGTAMTVVPPQASDVTVSLSLQGSASQRVVDGDTGQVTISQVYYAQ